MKPLKVENQKEIFAYVVKGKIKNVHTSNDTTLTIFESLYKEFAFGR